MQIFLINNIPLETAKLQRIQGLLSGNWKGFKENVNFVLVNEIHVSCFSRVDGWLCEGYMAISGLTNGNSCTEYMVRIDEKRRGERKKIFKLQGLVLHAQ